MVSNRTSIASRVSRQGSRWCPPYALSPSLRATPHYHSRTTTAEPLHRVNRCLRQHPDMGMRPIGFAVARAMPQSPRLALPCTATPQPRAHRHWLWHAATSASLPLLGSPWTGGLGLPNRSTTGAPPADNHSPPRGRQRGHHSPTLAFIQKSPYSHRYVHPKPKSLFYFVFNYFICKISSI